MADRPKLTREQQLAEWRKQQRSKSQQNLKTLGPRVKRESLQMRLRFWGTILLIAGLMTLAINSFFLFKGRLPIVSAVFVVWGLTLVVVAVLDFVKASTGMLILTGVITLIHAPLTILSGSSIIGTIIFIGASGFVGGFFIERIADSCQGRRNGTGCQS